jgi:hypothetical protein
LTWTNGINSGLVSDITETPYALEVSDPGTYTITSVYDLHCSNSGTGSGLIVQSNIPPAPVISVDGALLTSDAPEGNQWYLDDEPIPGATGQNYTAVENGSYYDIVTLNGCVSDPSNIIDILTIGIGEREQDSFQVFPNPASDVITVEADNLAGSYDLSVFTLQGRLMYSQKEIGEQYHISTVNYPPGIYFIRIQADTVVYFRKVLVR